MSLHILLVLLFLILFFSSSLAIPLATYSMISLGAKFDGRTDSTKAFLAAWAKVVSQPRPQPFTCHLGGTCWENTVF